MSREHLESMKLGELRKLYPTIKATKKADFIKKVEALQEERKETIPSGELLEALQLQERIRTHMPKVLLDAVFKQIGCTCLVEAYEAFVNNAYEWTLDIDRAVIDATYILFGEHVKKTSCSSCLINRRDRLVKELKARID